MRIMLCLSFLNVLHMVLRNPYISLNCNDIFTLCRRVRAREYSIAIILEVKHALLLGSIVIFLAKVYTRINLFFVYFSTCSQLISIYRLVRETLEQASKNIHHSFSKLKDMIDSYSLFHLTNRQFPITYDNIRCDKDVTCPHLTCWIGECLPV